ncbi:MAG: hypothetical protein ACREYE_16795, partial [Gammaproteobacteria bacterium]
MGRGKVLVKEATFKLETVPAAYADVEERIEVSPAYTVWTTGDTPVSKPANPSLVASVRAGGVPVDQATPGQCFVEHYQGAQFSTEKQKVMKKEASEFVKKPTALGISRSGGARNPHVFQYTLRFLRSGGTRPSFAR